MKKLLPSRREALRLRAYALLMIFLPQALLGGPDGIATPEDCPPSVNLTQDVISRIEASIDQCYKDLELIQKSVDEWGHAGFSDLVFLPDARGRIEGAAKPFQLYSNIGDDKGQTYKNLLTDVVNPQGGAAFLDQASTAIGIKGRLGQDALLGSSQELLQQKTEISQSRLVDADRLESLNQQIREMHAQELLAREQHRIEQAAAGRETADTADDINALPVPGTGASTTLLPPLIGTGVTLPDPGATTSASVSTLPATTPPVAESDFLSKTSLNNPFTDTKFAAANKLFAPNTFSISPSQAITLAASAKTKENLLAFLADPLGQGIISANQTLFLGVGTVSVSPGMRTGRDYICEVQARPKFKNPSSRIAFDSGPQVIAAYPFAEGQVLDLQYTKQRQFQFMTDLAAAYAAAGNTAGAQLMFNHIRRMQKDVATETFIPAVVPSSDGTQLTYRFDPSLMAIGRPSAWKSGPEDRLLPVNVPILVLIACNKSELEQFSEIAFDVSVRWLPKERRHWAKRVGVDWWWHGRVVDKRQDAEITQARTEAFDRIMAQINWMAATLAGHNASIKCIVSGETLIYDESGRPIMWRNRLKELKARFQTFETLALSVDRWKELPLPLPSITQVSLSQRQAEGAKEAGKALLTIHGSGFGLGEKNLVTGVYLRGKGLCITETKHHCPETGEDYIEAEIDDIDEKWLKDATNSSRIEVVTKGGRASHEKLDARFLAPTPVAAKVVSLVPSTLKAKAPPRPMLLKVENFDSKEMATIPPEKWNVYVGNVKMDVVTESSDNNTIFLNLPAGEAPFSEGKHEVNVWVQGTKKFATQAAGLTVTASGLPEDKPKQPEMKFTEVWPKRGYVRASTMVMVKGSGFMDDDTPVVQQVLVEGRQCRFEVLAKDLLIVTIPPWSEGELKSFNTEKTAATLRIIANGRAPLEVPQAIYFDMGEPQKEMTPAPDLNAEDRVILETIRSKVLNQKSK